MERTVLRLAAVAALVNAGNGPPWPTVAGGYVYDSMYDAVNDVIPEKRRPIAIVRTDEDQNVYQGRTLAGRRCRLLIEVGVLTAATVIINGKEEARVAYPATESSLEAFLDMFEWQVQNALFGNTDWAQWFMAIGGYSVLDFASVPRFSPPERGSARLAVRTLQILLNIPNDCIGLPIKQYSVDPQQHFLPPRWVAFVDAIQKCGTGAFLKSVQETAAIIAMHGPLPRPAYPPLQTVWASVPQGDGIEADWQLDQEAPFVAEPLATPEPEITIPAAGIT